MQDLTSILAIAVEHHRRGQLAEAERLYRQILEAAPEHPEALHFLGVAAHQRGSLAEAEAWVLRALARKDRPAFFSSLGNILKGQGRTEEAIAAYRGALARKPDMVEAHN